MRGGGGEQRTYGFCHETASAFHPKQPCGRIARSLVAHHSSTVYRVSSGHPRAGDGDQPRFQGGRDVWITY